MQKRESLNRYRVSFSTKLTDAGETTWFVVDRMDRSGPRRLGTGPCALHDARWLARVLNGLEAERRAPEA
jgi:hypothetical protein